MKFLKLYLHISIPKYETSIHGGYRCSVCRVWGDYRQNENAKIYREEKNKMHQELMKQRKELQAASLDVAKLKQMLELERKNAEEILNKTRNKR